MGKCKALETALNNKLLSSHEHLKKCIFSPPPVCIMNMDIVFIERDGIVPTTMHVISCNRLFVSSLSRTGLVSTAHGVIPKLAVMTAM